MNKKIYYPLLVLCLAFAAPFVAFADNVDPLPDPTLDTPIDGGLGLLLAAGVGYGIKKVRDHRKKNNEADLLSK